MDTIVRVHWLGKRKIAADTNSAELMNVWKMPESVKLEAQTLDKLSQAPWRLLRGETNQAATNLLRPLLQDLADEESYVEVHRPANSTNATEEMILSVRLDSPRAGLWRTNVAAALESLTGIKPVSTARGWSLKKHHSPNLIEFARAGEWTVLGAAVDHNGLLDETVARIEREHAPFSAPKTNAWLEVDIDVAGLASIMGVASNFAAQLPKVSLANSWSEGMVHTMGELTFPAVQFADLQAWTIPTNLMDPDLSSFTVMRGLRSWLDSSELWSNLQAGPPPDQLDIWASRAFSMKTYFAAPSKDASNTVSRLSDLVLQKTSSKTNEGAKFVRASAFNGVQWKGIPFMTPFLQNSEFSGTGYIYGGGMLIQPQPTDGNPPPELLHEVLSRSNLIYYDWERTGLRMDQWIYMGQFARFVLSKAQLPDHSAGLKWLKAVEPRMGNALTGLSAIDKNRLSIIRHSDLGLTAVELNLLIDWLESPDFPRGLHTTLAPPPAQ
jgi:hypothetical protein